MLTRLRSTSGATPLAPNATPSVHNRSPDAPAILPERKLWVRSAQILLMLSYVAVIVIFVVALVYLITRGSERHVLAFAIALLFVGIAVPLSLHDIHLHALHYVRPDIQRYYVRILWMVPIYSIESWFALYDRENSIYFEVAREAYEAFVIYSLYSLLLHFLGGRESLKNELAGRHIRDPSRSDVAHMLPPFCCLRPWRMGGQFVNRTSVGVFQYVFLRTTLAITSLILVSVGHYGEGQWSNFRAGYIYFVIILNCSQVWAMWNLVMFYHELKDELAPLHPLGKFLVIKAVVFFSFWQSLLISLLQYLHVIQGSEDVTDPAYYPTADIASGLQDFLICIEMVFAAIAHRFIFTYQDFEHMDMVTPRVIPGAANDVSAPVMVSLHSDSSAPVRHHGALRAVVDMLPLDVVMETGQHFRHGFGLMKSTKIDRVEAARAAAAANGSSGKGSVDPASSPDSTAVSSPGGGTQRSALTSSPTPNSPVATVQRLPLSTPSPAAAREPLGTSITVRPTRNTQVAVAEAFERSSIELTSPTVTPAGPLAALQLQQQHPYQSPAIGGDAIDVPSGITMRSIVSAGGTPHSADRALPRETFDTRPLTFDLPRPTSHYEEPIIEGTMEGLTPPRPGFERLGSSMAVSIEPHAPSSSAAASISLGGRASAGYTRDRNDTQ